MEKKQSHSCKHKNCFWYESRGARKSLCNSSVHSEEYSKPAIYTKHYKSKLKRHSYLGVTDKEMTVVSFLFLFFCRQQRKLMLSVQLKDTDVVIRNKNKIQHLGDLIPTRFTANKNGCVRSNRNGHKI